MCLEHQDPHASDQLWDITCNHALAHGENTDHLRMQQVQVQVMATCYFERFGKDPNMEAEVGFDHPVMGRGRLDGVATERTEHWDAAGKFGDPVPVTYSFIGKEDKGFSLWNDGRAKALSFDAQVSSYFIAMRDAGRPLDKLRYRVSKKPTIKQNSRIQETLEQYRVRLLAKYRENLADYYLTYDLYRTEDELAAFEAGIVQQNKEMRKAVTDYNRTKDIGLFRQTGVNTGSCGAYGATCTYMSLCTGAPGADVRYRAKPERPGTELQWDVLEMVALAMMPVPIGDVAKMLGQPAQRVTPAIRALESRELVTNYSTGDMQLWKATPAGARLAADR